MSYDKPLSLSLQKEIEKRNLSLDSEIHTALQTLRIKSLLCRSNIMKRNGYTTVTLLYWLLLLPFIMKRTTFLWTGHTFLNAKKDTFYRFLNNEYFHWRTFIYRLVLKMIAICDETPLRDKTLIYHRKEDRERNGTGQLSFRSHNTKERPRLPIEFNWDTTTANSSSLSMQDSMSPKADRTQKQKPSINEVLDGEGEKKR